MTKAKRSRKQISSIVAIVLCFCMLLGTTFAWFTDQVNSVDNIIQAGNLDVELYHTNANVKNEEQVLTDTALFVDAEGDEIEWEPGVVAWENFTVKNEGSLALKYDLSVLFKDLNHVKDEKPELQFVLSDALSVAIVEGGVSGTTRDAVLAEVKDSNAKTWESLQDFSYSGELLPKNSGEGKDSKTYGMVIYWHPGDDDNNWNVNNGKAVEKIEGIKIPEEIEVSTEKLQINLGIKLEATQYTYESDSFDHQYDKYANGYIPVEEDLEKDELKVIKLQEDIILDKYGTNISSPKTIKLNGHNIRANRVYTSGSTNMDKHSALKITADVTIEGPGEITNLYDEFSGNNGEPPLGVWALTIDNGATVRIKGGRYISDDSTLYVQNGHLIIEGGFFQQRGDKDPTVGNKLCDCCHSSSVINVGKGLWEIDRDSKDGTDVVTITGGTFVNFDPSNVREDGFDANKASNSLHGMNYVAKGYKVVEELQDNKDIWYTVVKAD